jgi:hypothetical protein
LEAAVPLQELVIASQQQMLLQLLIVLVCQHLYCCWLLLLSQPLVACLGYHRQASHHLPGY